MRAIIFRGRDFLGNWHRGVISADGNHIVTPHPSGKELYQVVEKSTIGQFTGTYDDRGVDIYEGYIVEMYDKNDLCIGKGTITYIPNQGAFMIASDGLYNIHPASLSIRVIGTIHD